MSKIKDNNQVTVRWLNNNGISYLIPELIKYKIIEDKGRGLYYILNKKALYNIIKKEYDELDLNDGVSKLQFSVYASKFFCEGCEVRRNASIEDDSLNSKEAIKLYNMAIFNFIKYINLRDTVLKDPTFNGHFELGKTYLKLNNRELAKKELSIALNIAIKKQSFHNLGRVKFQLAELSLSKESYYKALILYFDLLNNKDVYRMNINEYKDVLYKINICKSNLLPSTAKKDAQNYILIKTYENNGSMQTFRLHLEDNEKSAHELLIIAEQLYIEKKLFLADYLFKKAKKIAKKYKDKNDNIEIANLQKQIKIYKN
jgi:Tfp pilus assembly protein PilF